VALTGSDDGFESVVYDRRCGLGAGVDGIGMADDSGGGVFLLWPRSSKIGLITYMAFIDVSCRRLISGTHSELDRVPFTSLPNLSLYFLFLYVVACGN
jgi:hypothetical protein